MITGDQVRSTTFPAARRAGEGYRESDVDELLDAVAELMDHGGNPRTMLTDCRFAMPRRGGYRAQEVDAFIDQLLAHYPHPPVSRYGPKNTSGPANTPAATASSGPLTQASWETKQPSFWKRLFG